MSRAESKGRRFLFGEACLAALCATLVAVCPWGHGMPCPTIIVGWAPTIQTVS
jgi:hypothetical protein